MAMSNGYGIRAVMRELKHWITDHTIVRFRERTGAVELRSLPDADVARIVDDAVSANIDSAEEVSDRDYPDAVTTVVPFTDRSGQALIAVLRDLDNSSTLRPRGIGPRSATVAVRTILTGVMGDFARECGRWVPWILKDGIRVLATRPPSAAIVTPDAPGGPSTAHGRAIASLVQAPDAATRLEVIADVVADAVEASPESRRGREIETEDARRARAREILISQPRIALTGSSGLDSILRAEFGVGMAWETMRKIRDELDAAAGRTLVSTPPPAPSKLTLGDQLTRALATEQRAKATLTRALATEQRAKATLTEATRAHSEAVTEVNRLLADITATRRG